MASATASNVIQGQSLKSHFMPIWELALLIQSFIFFKSLHYLSKIKRLISESIQLTSSRPRFCWRQVFFEIFLKLCIKRVMWFYRLTSDHVWGCSWGHVCLIWLQFSDNVGMILFFIWYFLKKKLRWTSSPKTDHFKCMKTYE